MKIIDKLKSLVGIEPKPEIGVQALPVLINEPMPDSLKLAALAKRAECLTRAIAQSRPGRDLVPYEEELAQTEALLRAYKLDFVSGSAESLEALFEKLMGR